MDKNSEVTNEQVCFNCLGTIVQEQSIIDWRNQVRGILNLFIRRTWFIIMQGK